MVKFIKNKQETACAKLIEEAADDGYDRLIEPSVQREVRAILTDRAGEQAIKMFEVNLRPLLLQPPVKGKVTLGLDPGYRTGCKVAVVDETGKVLDTSVIYPVPPKNDIEGSKKIIKYLIEKHSVDVISIGNGTASKETEIFVADLLKEKADLVSDKAVNYYGRGVEKEYMLEIMSRSVIRSDKIFDILVKEFRCDIDNVPVCAGYLAAYGDERALPYLLDKIDEEGISFIEYKELLLAIESLGGTYDKRRDFSSDPYYGLIKSHELSAADIFENLKDK